MIDQAHLDSLGCVEPANEMAEDLTALYAFINKLGRPLTGDEINIYLGLRALCRVCYNASAAAGWWNDLVTGERKDRNKGEMLMLMVSEISEAMEGERKSLYDDKLPHRPMAEVEMADAVIREADYCGGFGYDLAGAVLEKLAFNANRADHKIENRKRENGKQF